MDNEKTPMNTDTNAERIAELEEQIALKTTNAPRRNNRIFTIVFILIFIIGLSMAVYPFVSDLVIESKQDDAVEEYQVAISAMSEEEKNAEFEKAQEYNSAESGDYTSALASGDIMCVVEVPVLDVKLPVYHGTSAKVLDFALGHIETTSLPVGGEGTHCVITGHTGLTRVRILDNLDKTQVGDMIYIHILGKVLEYKIDDINIIEPNDTSCLLPVAGEDYLTLVTCYPYGINSHRLCVRGTRVGTQDEATFVSAENEENTSQTEYSPAINDTRYYSGGRHRGGVNYIRIALVVAGAIGLIVFVIILAKPKKKNK